MAKTVTLGGERLGSGKKQKVELHGYERSTHDLGYLWRSTMSAGTLVPFISEVALPGDTFDINLDCDIKTHPTIGPLFGSFKVQLDIFQAPIRLYQGQLHNNKLGIGMNMANVKLPIIQLVAGQPTSQSVTPFDNQQVNPSCLLAYLGIRGIGWINSGDPTKIRAFNGVPFLAYWDIYKQYYSNKPEEIGMVIHTPALPTANMTVDDIGYDNQGTTGTIPVAPATGSIPFRYYTIVNVNWTGTEPTGIILTTDTGQTYLLDDLFYIKEVGVGTTQYRGFIEGMFGPITISYWRYTQTGDSPALAPQITSFPLENIDTMRENILAAANQGATPFDINLADLTPYNYIALEDVLVNQSILYSQEGLGLKTYQSDLFNNWLNTEWIDGTGGITEVTAIDTSGGSFTLDTLNLSKKVYDMLNRIAVSGGTYDDWLDTVYDHDRIQRAESPIYHGGLIKELIFQEVVSNSEASTPTNIQPLGTLAGKGIMGNKHKGGKVTIKVDEPSYIIGIISLTPRIDYSQGNKWDIHLMTMDDLHKPALDEIGFQELLTEQMAWWSTSQEAAAGPWVTRSAGKQPAWINYMTNVNRTYGNFADAGDAGEMFMTLNRKYEMSEVSAPAIKDLTTYIDPSKYNNIFAQQSLDSQNFWAQIAVDMTARRKMSAKIMPNL